MLKDEMESLLQENKPLKREVERMKRANRESANEIDSYKHRVRRTYSVFRALRTAEETDCRDSRAPQQLLFGNT